MHRSETARQIVASVAIGRSFSRESVDHTRSGAEDDENKSFLCSNSRTLSEMYKVHKQGLKAQIPKQRQAGDAPNAHGTEFRVDSVEKDQPIRTRTC